MISKIEKLKGFGVFRNFDWGNLPEFQVRNIIYGWNYSGKTTLSRLFYLIEDNNKGESSTDFTMHTDGGIITSDNISSNNLLCRVYNEEFRERNLRWDGQSFNPILLLGQDNIETQNLIKKLEGEIAKEDNIGIDFLKRAEQERRTYESDLTAEAGRIKEILILGTFTKTHLKQYLTMAQDSDLENLILSEEEVSEFRSKATATERLTDLPKIDMPISFQEDLNEVERLLLIKPVSSIIIQDLRQNEDLGRWVLSGREFHSVGDSCHFCGGRYSQSRATELSNHFSEEYDSLIQDLERVSERISRRRIKLNLRSKNDFYRNLHQDIEKVAEQLSEASVTVNKYIDEVIQIIQEKIRAPFEIESLRKPGNEFLKLQELISQYNALADNHNSINTNFESTKQAAIEKLKQHYSGKFAKNRNISHIEKKISVLQKLATRAQRKRSKAQTMILKLKAKVRSIEKGRERLNRYIQGFLGHDGIKIAVQGSGHDTERFVINRDNQIARNLSEGEKTAIAFSYFLTKLEEEPIQDTVVYIDDPISSLDSNHIYHVFALICNALFDENQPKCKQLFISTHNFDFFTLLKESKQFAIKANSTGKYYLERVGLESKIKEMPNALKNYKSEYQFLFKILMEFNNSSDKMNSPYLLLIPGVIRKFLEAYTSARIPSPTNLEDRVNIVFKDSVACKSILKFINAHSHFNGVLQQGKHDDTIHLCEPTVKYIMDYLIAKDGLHMNALVEAVK